MQQSPFSQNEQTMGLIQKRLILFFSSFVLALVQLLLLFFGIYSHLFFGFAPDGSPGPRSIALQLGLFIFLYCLVPIPMSLFLSYQTKRAQDGRKAGGVIGCMGALLALTFEIISASVAISIGVVYSSDDDRTIFTLIIFFFFFMECYRCRGSFA